MLMALYGIYGEHTQEACPLYNEGNRKFILKNLPNVEKNAKKYNVRYLQQYHSALEHTFIWVAEADSPHSIEELMGRTAGRFNTLKIVPLITFQQVIERCKSIENGTFFDEAAM
jgi:Domain of unknown function (DUF3303)